MHTVLQLYAFFLRVLNKVIPDHTEEGMLFSWFADDFKNSTSL